MLEVVLWTIVFLVPGAFLFAMGYLLADHSKKNQCWHHEHATGESWITGRMANMGANKLFTCTQCRKRWFV